MITQLRRTIERLNRSTKRDGDKGFSLIELIIVIVILGILVAIAIPIYNHIQNTAKQNAVATAAQNGATQATEELATNQTVDLSNLSNGTISVAPKAGTTTTSDDVCVVATNVSDSSITASAGPGC